MSPKATEGVAAREAPTLSETKDKAGDLCETTPSDRFAAISPSRGRLRRLDLNSPALVAAAECRFSVSERRRSPGPGASAYC